MTTDGLSKAEKRAYKTMRAKVMRERRQKHSNLGADVERILQGDQAFFPVAPLDGSVEEGWPTCKYIMWEIFETPDVRPTMASVLVTGWIMSLVAASSVLAVIQTLPTIRIEQRDLWIAFEYFFQIRFTIELIVRVTCCPDKAAFFYNGPVAKTSLNWIDIIVVGPFWLEEILTAVASSGDTGNLTWIRLLRLGKGVRLVKLGRKSRGLAMLQASLGQSVDALQLFLLILGLITILCSCTIYFMSRGEWDTLRLEYHRKFNNGGFKYDDGTPELYDYDCWSANYTGTNMTQNDCKPYPSPFQSVPQCFWFTMVSLMTVGYGEVTPITYTGQLMGAITVLVGIITLVLPLSIIQSSFVDERRKMKAEATEEKNYLAIRQFIEKSAMPDTYNPAADHSKTSKRSFVALQEQVANDLGKATSNGIINTLLGNNSTADERSDKLAEQGLWDQFQQANDDLNLLPTVAVLVEQLQKTQANVPSTRKAAESCLALIANFREKSWQHRSDEADEIIPKNEPWHEPIRRAFRSSSIVMPFRQAASDAHPDESLSTMKDSRLTGKEYLIPLVELQELYTHMRQILLCANAVHEDWNSASVDPNMKVEPTFSVIPPLETPRVPVLVKLNVTSPTSEKIRAANARLKLKKQPSSNSVNSTSVVSSPTSAEAEQRAMLDPDVPESVNNPVIKAEEKSPRRLDPLPISTSNDSNDSENVEVQQLTPP